jgi:hypothetical protein
MNIIGLHTINSTSEETRSFAGGYREASGEDVELRNPERKPSFWRTKYRRRVNTAVSMNET